MRNWRNAAARLMAVLALASCSGGGGGGAATTTTSGSPSTPSPVTPAPPPASPPAASSPSPVYSWTSSFAAPETDSSGARLTGTEIIDIVAHDARLFAGNSYWNETTELRRGQVFRLDTADGRWALDLQMPPRYSRVSSLASTRLERDRQGRAIAARTVLIAGATYDYGNLPGPVGFFVREDAGRWQRTDLGDTADPIGYSEIRSIGEYRDPITGADLIFLRASPAPHGIYVGGVNADSGQIVFDANPELTAIGSDRFLTFAECAGRFFVGAKRRIYRRNDGPAPTTRWELVLDLTNPATSAPLVGVLDDTYWAPEDDIRGLTCLTDQGSGAPFLIFGALNQMARVDLGAGPFTVKRELDIEAFVEEQLGYDVRYIQTAEHQPILSETRLSVSFVGMEAQYEEAFLRAQPQTPHFPTSGFSPEGFYLERRDNAGSVTYALRTVDRLANEDLARVRAFEPSPFPNDSAGALYTGGFAPWFTPTTNTAWIKRGVPIDYTALIANAAVERTQNWRGSGQAALVVTPNAWNTAQPTILFSHGAGSSPESYLCWPQIYAENNFRTVLPYLPSVITPQTRAERFSALQRMHAAALQQQAATKLFFAGHSFGAYATLLTAGADGRLNGTDPGNCIGPTCAPLAAGGYIVISGQPAQSALNASPYWFSRTAFSALAAGRFVLYGSRDYSTTDLCLSAGVGNPSCRGDSFTIDENRATELGNQRRVVSGFEHGSFACGSQWRKRPDASVLEGVIGETAAHIRARAGP